MGALGNLIPLVILFAVVAGLGYVGYQISIYSSQLADRGKKGMERKNITFEKGGMKVGVKEIKNEDYADKTQSVLVNAWNLGRVDSNGRPSTGRTASSSSQKKRS